MTDYLSDNWCQKLRENLVNILEGTLANGLQHWKGTLIISRSCTLNESLFDQHMMLWANLAWTRVIWYSDICSFGQVCKRTLRPHTYCCEKCASAAKSSTKQMLGPLVGLLPDNAGFHYHVSVTDRLNTSIWLIPYMISTPQLAQTFLGSLVLHKWSPTGGNQQL